MTYFRYSIVSLLLVISGSTHLYGQTKNNIMSIDDRIFPVYQKATTLVNDTIVFQYADSILRLAKQYNDPKAETLAYTFALKYFFKMNNEEGMAKAVEECKRVARKNDYLQYFYYAYVEQITMLINMREYAKVKMVLKDLQEWAQKDDYPYGWACCYTQLGHLARNTYNYKLAVDYYLRATKYYELANQPVFTVYTYIANCYNNMNELENAEFYFEKAYNAAYNDMTRMNVLVEMANFANRHRQFEKMENLYIRVDSLSKTCGVSTNNAYLYLKLHHYLLKKEYNKYLMALDSINNDNDRIIYRQVYELTLGNYKEAYILADSLLKMTRRSIGTETQLVLSELSNKMETALLEAENTKLELEQKEHEAQTNRMMLVFLSIIIAIIVIIFIAYSRMRGRVIARLQRAWKHAIQQEQKAIAANNLKNDFIQNMSHEIRTPLNGIVGFSQILCDPQMEGLISPEEKNEYGTLIKANANMMTSLIEDILSLTDIENGHYKLHTNDYNLNDICSFSVETAGIRCPNEVKMYFTSEVDDDYKVFTDSHRVQQVLMNMLTNSCKHTSEGEIHLHCAVNEPKQLITFTVTDTGKGIPPEMAEEIFERFKKLDKFVQGTGLGLSICRIIAELLEGKIYLDTTYTGGARFVFEMKLHKTLPPSNTSSDK